jgi:hypothetical protein
MISSFYLYEDHHDHFNHHILLINKNHLIRLIKIIISIYSDQVSFKNHHLVLFYKKIQLIKMKLITTFLFILNIKACLYV